MELDFKPVVGRRAAARRPLATDGATSSPPSDRRWAPRTSTRWRQRWPPRGPTSRRSGACRKGRWRRSRSTPCCRTTATARRCSGRCWRWPPAPGFDVSLQRESLYRRSKRLVVMDMDSTLIRIEVIDELARAAGVGPEVSRITERAMQGEMDYDESLRQRVGLLKGLDVAVLDRIAADLPLTDGAETLVRVLKRLGYSIAVISGGFSRAGRGAEAPAGHRLRLLEQPRGRSRASSPAGSSGPSSTPSARPSCSRPSPRPRACCSIR